MSWASAPWTKTRWPSRSSPTRSERRRRSPLSVAAARWRSGMVTRTCEPTRGGALPEHRADAVMARLGPHGCAASLGRRSRSGGAQDIPYRTALVCRYQRNRRNVRPTLDTLPCSVRSAWSVGGCAGGWVGSVGGRSVYSENGVAKRYYKADLLSILQLLLRVALPEPLSLNMHQH